MENCVAVSVQLHCSRQDLISNIEQRNLERPTADIVCPAPIALFVYNRLWHTQQTVEALANNELAAASELFVFSDGPRSEADREQVQSVREYLKSVTGFKSVNVVEREKNLGCARSITSGVTEIVNRFGQIIVVEDDIVTSPWFLRYMNEALEFYRDEERVACIHGYLFPVKQELPKTFFLKGADIWGWATWKRGWDLYEPDERTLYEELNNRKLTREFDFDGSFYYTRILKEQIKGKLDTWDIQWYASAFLRDKLTLYPGKSLVKNIGNDCSGTHCNATDKFDTDISREPVRIEKIPLEEHKVAREVFKKFFRSLRPSISQRVANRIKRMMRGNT